LISIVIPTIRGREDSFRRCVDAYRATTEDCQIIPIRNEKACGIAWGWGAQAAQGDYLHFTADDLVPHEGWADAAIECVERGNLPAATVLNPVVPLDCPVYLEPKYRNVPNVLVPFFSREQWELGRWIVPIHYGSDDWVTYLARRRGIEVELLPDYLFTHSADPEGRLWMNRAVDVPRLASYMELEGYVPHVYGDFAVAHGWAGWIG
jgi:hypothetical protein